MKELDRADQIQHVLQSVKPLATEYYRLTGKPLGVTGEIAEYAASMALGLELAPPRTKGYDATRMGPGGKERIQIKGRAFNGGSNRSQRIGSIKAGNPCDVVMLVLLDIGTLDLLEIWEAPYATVTARLAEPGSVARNERGALAVSDFRRFGRKVWSKEAGTLVFAYGSNMDDAQIRLRCPGAEKVGNAVLRGHRLCFPRQSKNRGCGVASVELADGQDVWGVVLRLNAQDLASLDKSEGFRADRPALKNGYNRLAIIVEMDGAPAEVQTYVAVASPNPSPPSSDYLALIRDGASHHGLPEAYQAFLAALGA